MWFPLGSMGVISLIRVDENNICWPHQISSSYDWLHFLLCLPINLPLVRSTKLPLLQAWSARISCAAMYIGYEYPTIA